MSIYYWAAVATIVAAGATAFPFVRKLFRAFCRFPKVAYRFIGVFVRAVHLVDHELTNNNGTSLKDKVEQTADQVAELRKWTVHHDGLHEGLQQRGWVD